MTARIAEVQDQEPLRTIPGADERLRARYDEHATVLYRFLLEITLGDQHAAEDLLQETLLRAWRNIEHLDSRVGTLLPSLLRWPGESLSTPGERSRPDPRK
jgi:DNA-directed RNA polymerase specialized sigma24 family protein